MRRILKVSQLFCDNKLLSSLNNPSFSKLQNRSIIIVHGQQSRKFLQGLTTNNISLLFQPKSKSNQKQFRISLYSLFLNPKGKVITDAIIFRPIVYQKGIQTSPNDEFWIDVSKDTSTNLYEHLRKYTWKKKVELFNLTHQNGVPNIYAGFNKFHFDSKQILHEIQAKSGFTINIQSEQNKKISADIEDGAYANIAFYDPRGSTLGVRMVCGPQGFSYKGTYQQVKQQQYEKLCRLSGISSSSVMANKLPFMFNTDLFNAFSFNKGCYLGQQIAARSYYTGIVRRRIFPYILQDSNKKLEVGQTLFDENKKQVGKVVQSENGYGTIQCLYLPLLNQNWPLKIEQPVRGIVRIPFQGLLRKYIQDIKAKQAKLQEIDL